MDVVEASPRKERGGKIVDRVREKRDLRQAISRGQGIGDLHLKFVFVDTDTLETRILPCHRAQPFPGSAADFKDGASARQVAFRKQIRRQSTLFTDMGIAYAQQGNVQTACHYAIQALAITTQTKSLSVLERVRQVRNELESWKDTQDVKDLERQLETTSIRIAT
jgi:hypothetical protein